MTNFINLAILTSSLCFAFGCGSPQASKTAPAVPAQEQPEKRSIGKFMESNNELAIGERIARYHELKSDSPNAYNFEEEKELNQYGYSLLFSDKPQEAIEVFKLLVSEFPNDANPYDSLAEAYKGQADTE
jgi:hypothetical protein